MRRVSGAVGAVLQMASVAAAQTSPVAHFSPTAVSAYADSFVTLIRGVPQGWHRYSLEKTSDDLRFTDAFALGANLRRTVVVTLTPRLTVTTVRSTGREFGQAVAVQLDYVGQRARGWAVMRGESQPRRVAIDTVLPEGGFDGNALMAFLPLLDWRVGATYRLTLFDTDEGSITTQMLRIASRDTVTVPAGTFEAYRADLSTTQAPVRLWYTTAEPHRLIKMGDPTDTFVTLLVGKTAH